MLKLPEKDNKMTPVGDDVSKSFKTVNVEKVSSALTMLRINQ